MTTTLDRLDRRTEEALRPWESWDAKMKFADQLVKTGFLPSAVKTPGQALSIIFTGQEIGIPPMHALRSIHVIQGKPTMSAELMLALFKQRGGKAQWRRSDGDVAELWLRHPNGDEHVETFTLEDAKRASLTSKDGWRNYPKAMLRARATSAGLRAVAPDIIAGIYDPEELGADVTVDGEVIVPAPQAIPEPTPFDGAAEIEPESGRPEVPVERTIAPIDDWKDAMRQAQTEKALQHLWKGCTAPDVWNSWTKLEREQLISEKDAAKQRLAVVST